MPNNIIYTLFDKLSDGYMLCNKDKKVQYINSSGKKLLGLDDDFKDYNLTDFYPTWIQSLILQSWFKTIEKYGSWEGESVILTKDKREIPVFQQLIFQQSDNIFSEDTFCLVFRDVSQYKETLDALLSSQNRYKEIFDNNPIPLLIVNQLDDKIVQANDSASKLLGQSIFNLANCYLSDFIDTDSTNDFISFTNEHTIAIKNSEQNIFFCELAKSSLVFDGKQCWLIKIEDITDKLKWQNAIIKNEANLNAVIESTNDAIWSVDTEGNIVIINTTYKELYKAINGKDINLGMNLFEFVALDHKERAIQNFKMILEGERLVYERSYLIESQEKHYEVTVNPIRNQNNEVRGVTYFSKDVTEKKKAEYELKSSEERYRFMFQFSPLPMWLWDSQDYQFIDVNESAILKYGFSKNEFVNKKITDIFINSTFSNYPSLFSENLSNSTSNIVCKHYTKNNSVIDVELTSHTIFIEGKSVRLSLANDVTEQLKAIDSLRKSEANLSALINNTEDTIISIAPDHTIISINNTYVDLWKQLYNLDLKKGDNYFTGLTEEVKKRAINNFNKVMNGEKLQYDRYYTVNGKPLYYEVNVYPIVTDQGEISGVSYFGRDVTSRRIAEDNIRKSEVKYRNLVETMLEGVLYLDVSGDERFCNRKLLELLDFGARDLDDENIFNECLEESIDKLNELGLFGNSFDEQIELEFENRNGEKIHLLANRNNIVLDNSQSIGYLLTFTDITGLKNTEFRLLETNKDLNTFIYKSSHDIKGPVSTIKGLISLVKQEEINSDAKKIIDMIEASSKKLDVTVVDLLSAVRVKELLVNSLEINLYELINNILRDLLLKYAENNPLIINNTPKDFTLLADEKILAPAIKNIIDNSLYYRDSTKPKQVININFEEKEHYCLLNIEDNGVGIPSNIQDRVFEMFYRGDITSMGSGLGLYIAKSAIEKLKGSIKILSNEGIGTTVTIRLQKKI